MNDPQKHSVGWLSLPRKVEDNVPRLLSKKEAAARVGFHPEHVMRLAREHRFPQPIKLGNSDKCAVRFVAQEIDEWIAARMAERDACCN